ncbi:hypothetical protein EVAR_40160_1 [Eumeta japonica]|uniref:Uncharacterized protein n=1 Tax=Eumeta variegata TaxID=151549 RepID=A0A4C1YH01_EUMVA|nr:hypothetical protein EVAR_40160_1 [Eumeta japonica]
MSRAYVALSHSFFPSTVSLLLGRRRGNRWTPNFGTQISEDPSSSPKSARPCRSRMKSLFLQYFTLARRGSEAGDDRRHQFCDNVQDRWLNMRFEAQI